ncbi:tryptophan synthase beta subunit-like PLP-dependent enzyme [Aspergillus oleicola]
MAAPPRASSSLATIGNTPVLHLRNITPPNHVNIQARIAQPNRLIQRRMLKPGMTVVEATGGSTVVSSDVFAAEKIKTMRAFGADIDLVHVPDGKLNKELFPEIMRRASKRVESESAMYYCMDNLGRELVAQFPEGIDAFCGAAGSAGMLIGVSTVLKKQWAEKSPKAVGWTGNYGVEGISPGFSPPHLDDALCDEARAIDEQEGRTMRWRLARGEGRGSAGGNFDRLGPGKTMVTVACDTGLQYMNSSFFG